MSLPNKHVSIYIDYVSKYMTYDRTEKPSSDYVNNFKSKSNIIVTSSDKIMMKRFLHHGSNYPSYEGRLILKSK